MYMHMRVHNAIFTWRAWIEHLVCLGVINYKLTDNKIWSVYLLQTMNTYNFIFNKIYCRRMAFTLYATKLKTSLKYLNWTFIQLIAKFKPHMCSLWCVRVPVVDHDLLEELNHNRGIASVYLTNVLNLIIIIILYGYIAVYTNINI